MVYFIQIENAFMNVDELKLFKTIFEQSPVSTQIFSPDGNTLMVNTAWEELWNVKFSQVKEYNILSDKQLIETGSMPYIKKAFKGEIVFIPEIKYDPSKTIDIPDIVKFKWLSARMYPIKDNKNRVTHIVLQHEDVTQKRLMEENTNKLVAIIESSEDAIISKTLDGIITSWNKSAEKLFGYSSKEIVGKSILTIIPADFRSEEKMIISKLKNGEKIDHYETIRQRKNGEKIYVSLSISPIKDTQGTIIGASKIARDITQLKKSAEDIKESEERLRIALQAGKIGVWDWNIVKNELNWTENVYEIHGVTKDNFDVTFANFKNLIHPDDREYTRVKLEESFKGSDTFNAEFRVINPDGKIKWVITRAVISYDSNRVPIRMLGATTDITQQKQLEQEKNDFLSMASHELKTPLTSLTMFIDILMRELKDEGLEKKAYFAKRIKDQAGRLTELTNDLLDVSRIETGKLQLNKEEFKINDLVQDAVEGMQATSDKHKILVKTSKNFTVFADKYRLHQVLINLLSNAIKYSPSGKEIVIEIKNKKDEIVVSVKDDGRGIAKEQHNKIFERLYQVTDPEEKTFPGLGLGLFISKEIVIRHKGRMWVESEKGKGSTFYFSIPYNK